MRPPVVSSRFVVEARPAPPHLTHRGEPPHAPALVFVENVAGLRWNELTQVRFDRDDPAGGAVERCSAAVRLGRRWFITERDLPRVGASSVVVPQQESWVALEPESGGDDSPASDDPVSAIGFVARGDGIPVRITAVSVFADPLPAVRPERSLRSP